MWNELGGPLLIATLSLGPFARPWSRPAHRNRPCRVARGRCHAAELIVDN